MKEVHFWNVKENYCIILNNTYVEKLFRHLFSIEKFLHKIAKLSNINESTLRRLKNFPNQKITIKTLLKIVKFLKRNGTNLDLKDVESEIIWIGSGFGSGISNPNLPFQLNTQDFTKILSATFGDGTITNVSYSTPKKFKLGILEYYNNDSVLRKNIIDSSLKIFGGKIEEYKQMINKNNVSIKFPSIIRDTVLLAGATQGEKTVLNPSIPKNVMLSRKPTIWITWLKQTLDDEGSVRFRNNYNHEIYITRSVDITKLVDIRLVTEKTSFRRLPKKVQNIVKSYPPKLLVGEQTLFKRLGIDSRLKPQEVYITKNGSIKVKWRLYITRKDNIRKFSRIISFSNNKKQFILNKIIGDNDEIKSKNKRNTLESKIRTINKEKMGERKTLQFQTTIKKSIHD